MHRFTCPCFAINKICVLRGTFSPSGVVGFMNNAAADVKIMPVVVRSIFSLIPSPPAFFYFFGKKRQLSCWMRGTLEILGQTRGMWNEMY